MQADFPCISTSQILYCFTQSKKKLPKTVKLFINNQSLTEENSTRYLGIYIDSNLNWKSHINYIAKKVKRSIGTLSKLRYYLNSKTLLDLYYALVYPFLTYCIIAWGNTYQTSLQPLIVLQKKAIRIKTFSSFYEHTSPLFKDLNIIKLFDLLNPFWNHWLSLQCDWLSSVRFIHESHYLLL